MEEEEEKGIKGSHDNFVRMRIRQGLHRGKRSDWERGWVDEGKINNGRTDPSFMFSDSGRLKYSSLKAIISCGDFGVLLLTIKTRSLLPTLYS